MKIGLYFCSFNPIHTGHLIIASHILNESDIDKVWFVVSPHNPFKESNTLLNEYERFHLVQKAVEQDARLKAVDIEFSLPRPSYTVHTMAYLEEKYPTYQFVIIMGSDSFQNIEKWKNADHIIRHYSNYIYRRPGFEVESTHGAKAVVLDAPLLQISATRIREYIRSGKSARYMVPDKVLEEIEKGHYYK